MIVSCWVGADRPCQMVLHVAGRHPAGLKRNDHLVQPTNATGPLGDQPGLKGAITVPRAVQGNVATSVATVFRVAPLREFGLPGPARSPISQPK